MALEQKQKEYNWYYASFTYEGLRDVMGISSGLRWFRFVVFAKNPTEAKELATAYALKHMKEGESPFSLHDPLSLYQKNYIRESRALLEAGYYTGEKPVSV